MTFLAWVAGALLWLATSGSNLASAQAATTSAKDEEARALFEAGKVAYEDGRYADALGYFERSFELSHRAALQYNLGLAYDRLRRDREALQAYEAYLSAERDPQSSLEVENRVRALRESLAAEDAAKAEQSKLAPVAPVVPVQRTDSSAERTRKRRIWIGIAAGVVAVGAGVAISVLAAGSGEEARPKPNSGVTIEALSWH